jgi:hypothetical protein
MKLIAFLLMCSFAEIAMAFPRQIYLSDDCIGADVFVFESTTGHADCYFRRDSSTFTHSPVMSDIWACMLSTPSASAKSIWFSDDIITESPLRCLGVPGKQD